ncbi:2-oxo acid dehydrogenase subunit E2 [Actinokineospora auranticolor]|uniref:2-oxoacid dehydrogenase/acyltransferase catalytic subunit n=1 Tax=Actinokineospora auranticolor TaxID=155976 RepID=A0A2S6GLW7_9PSEU|nr:2-oxo acid dehydrogenase subunit E2 [Actinokineospora auranticolor]PPK66163.1 2-oxoacid dehydrogenase/acyltransferase catalytic subunit [Actinokineospora auranticolor]
MTARLPAQRRHTLFFLDQVREFAPVFLDTEVDMSAVAANREAAVARGGRYSVVAHVVHAAARVLVRHRRANAAVRGRLRPRVAEFDSAHAKVALDKRIGGERVVLAAVVREADRLDLDQVQAWIDRFRTGDADTMPEFAAVRGLHAARFPVALRRFRRAARSLALRPALTGTFAVTSLGHRPVDGFHSVGGTTITLGVGRVLDRPVVRGGAVGIAPVARLSLAFDHRVIDGAEAADVLTEIRAALESFPVGAAGPTEVDAP